MNQLIVIAFGGAFGAVLRYVVSSGVYQWLGRDFPYGTLAVNVVGSFLLGLLTEALLVERIAIAADYRAAILVGFIGAFTTFSTFSLETFYLLEQGNYAKVLINIAVSVIACLLAVWLGLLCSRGLFYGSQGLVSWQGYHFPYALTVINAIGAFIIGLIATLLLTKVTLEEQLSVSLLFVTCGLFLLFSGLYLVLSLLEQGYSISKQPAWLASVAVVNTALAVGMMWLGYLAGKDL